MDRSGNIQTRKTFTSWSNLMLFRITELASLGDAIPGTSVAFHYEGVGKPSRTRLCDVVGVYNDYMEALDIESNTKKIFWFNRASSVFMFQKIKESANRLRGSRVYLAGAMDKVSDGGVGWRRNITPYLQQMGIIVLDPCNKPTRLASEEMAQRQKRQAAKARGDYEYVRNEIKEIRQTDLRLVDIADFLIIHIDMESHPCGTFEELFWANRQKKPILLWIPAGKASCPDWLFGVLPHELFFETQESLINYVRSIHENEKIDTLNRWVFFDYDKI
jgi:hypothetical protein